MHCNLFCNVVCSVVTFCPIQSFVLRFLVSVGRPVLPIRYSGLRTNTRGKQSPCFVAVFTESADFQRLLHM